MLNILYEDREILVVEKPAGMESQSSRRFEPDMVSEIKNHIKISTKLSTKPSTGGNEPYVGVIHRLDKPVGGIMVYAKTQKAAAALSKQVQDGRMQKTYQTVVCGKPVDIVGNYVDYLLKDGKNNYSHVVDKSVKDGRRAELAYRVLKEMETEDGLLSLAEVKLLTGRHHQIRVQFASRRTPLWGDNKYNPSWGGTLPGIEEVLSEQKPEGSGSCRDSLKNRSAGRGQAQGGLALYSAGLAFDHPATGKRMEFSMKPKGSIFKQFEETQ